MVSQVSKRSDNIGLWTLEESDLMVTGWCLTEMIFERDEMKRSTLHIILIILLGVEVQEMTRELDTAYLQVVIRG